MKQHQIVFNGEREFLKELKKFQRMWGHTPKMMFQILSEVLEAEPIEKIGRAIEKIFPDTPWFGCSTSGTLVDCELVPGITVVAIVFEKESSQFEVFQYDTHEKSLEWITQKIIEDAEDKPWVKAIELYYSFPEESTTKFCEGLQDIDPKVHIFGGVSGNDDMTKSISYVFSKTGGYSNHAITVVFYGGDDFYVDSIKITGWKPLGKKFKVTKSEGSILQELDGVPAYDVYNKYLDISNDENFFYNTLEFPLLYEFNGITVLRTPMASNPDHSISTSADVEVGSAVRITYGDPQTIIESVDNDSQRIKKFRPDVIHFFSCVARRTYWAAGEPTYELKPFKDIAPSSGFFTLGEFLRGDNRLSMHNVTLVVAAMREGEAEQNQMQDMFEDKTASSKKTLVSRLATFISATSIELEEMNKKLTIAAISDGLTGLYNRAETQRRIEENLTNVQNNPLSLVMIDIDDFKQVNDTYGHQEGDTVLIALANILLKEQKRISEKISAGRWGGEEFMLVLANTDVSTATLIADLVRQCFENTAFSSIPAQTISVGVTQANAKDTFDTLCTRVDTALYKAKKNGKNKVIVI
ncbi:MAG: GGDEF domain-containing protein [Lachnospiraceae bacterium]|nr:GGDEF domain-containing protein [Lachnospiraceae bacterium]